MSEAELMDRYIDDLKRNPQAVPPPGLDAESAAFVRALVLGRTQAVPGDNLKERIWLKALTQAEGGTDSFGTRKASSNHTTENVRYLKPGERADMEDDMYTTDVYEPLHRTAPGTRPPEARYLLQYTATIAAAVLVLVVVGAVLIQMAHDPGNTGYPALVNAPTETPAPSVINAENVGQVQLMKILGRGLISDMDWSPDGTTLALGSSNGIVWLYDANALNAEPRFLTDDSTINELKSVLNVAFSPDGTLLASGRSDGSIQVWDMASGSVRIVISKDNNRSAVTGVAFSPDGKTLAWAFGKMACLTAVETGIELRCLEGHEKNVTSVAFSPDGNTVATGSLDQTMRLWNATTGDEIATLTGHENAVRSVIFSPDGRMIASGSGDDTVQLWDWNGSIAGTQQVGLKGHTGDVVKVIFSPDSKYVASASLDKSIIIWDTENGSQLHLLNGHSAQVRDIVFSPDGKTLASVSSDETLIMWDVATGQNSQQIAIPRGETQSEIGVAFSPDGKRVVSGGDDRIVRLWDVTTSALLQEFKGHTDIIWNVAYGPDGKTVASVGADRSVRLWDVATGEGRILEGHTSDVGGVAFSPDGKLLATSAGDPDSTVRVWDIATGESHILEGQSGNVLRVAFSPDGKLLASCAVDGTIWLWDMATFTLDKVLDTQSGTIRRIAFSPDGKTLASGGEDPQIRFWDVATGKQTGSVDGVAGAPLGSSIWGLEYSLDGSLLVSNSEGPATDATELGTIFWDIATGEKLRIMPNSLDSMVFSPDGTLMASARDDNGTIRIWGLPPGG